MKRSAKVVGRMQFTAIFSIILIGAFHESYGLIHYSLTRRTNLSVGAHRNQTATNGRGFTYHSSASVGFLIVSVIRMAL